MTNYTGPTIPDNLPLRTPVRDELARRLNLGGDVPIDLGRSTTFHPASTISVHVTEGNIWPEQGDKPIKGVTYVEILVHGRMEYKDRVDHGAVVTVRYTPNGVQHWCRSTAWNGRTFQDMPEGARTRVATTVRGLLGEIDWEALSAETQLADRARSINQQLSEARGLLDSARREMQGLAAPAKILHSGVAKSA